MSGLLAFSSRPVCIGISHKIVMLSLSFIVIIVIISIIIIIAKQITSPSLSSAFYFRISLSIWMFYIVV